MTTHSRDESKTYLLHFQLRCISNGFAFGNERIILPDPEKNLDFVLRKWVPEDSPEHTFEAGDGLVTVTCKREIAERLYNDAVSSGQLSIKKGAISNISLEMHDYMLRTMRLIRWRTNFQGKHNPIKKSLSGGYSWSVDGLSWKALADSISFKISLTVNPQWTSESEQFVSTAISGSLDEPLGHELLREAWTNRRDNPRSSVVLAVAAAEVGFKQFASQAFPDTAWILEHVPSPPLVRMLGEFFPWAKLGLQVNGKEAKPPDSLIVILKKAVLLRDEAVHRGMKKLNSETVEEVLGSVRDLLYFLDALQGQKWALEYLSADVRKQFV